MFRLSRLGTLFARIAARVERARSDGLGRTGVEAARLIVRVVVGLLLSPLTLALHLAGFRRLTFITNRVGHLAAEPDSFLKARALCEVTARRWFFLAPRGQVANEHLLSYWAPRIRVVRGPFACELLAAMSAFGLMRYNAGRYVLWLDHSQDIYRLNAAWNGRPPLLALRRDDERWGADMLEALGVPRGAWFACIHAREGGYSPQDEATHAHRNGSVEALVPAMQEIRQRGGWCIRMGDPTARPLPPTAGVIDYAHHRMRSARLDVYLCGRARFFLGNSSGIALVSSVFGVPSVLVNMVPMSALGVMPFDLSIPKPYRRLRDGGLLRFGEIFGTPAANFRFARQYLRAGIEVVENTPQEILDVTVEMLERLEGRFVAHPGDEALHSAFMALLRPGDYSYGAASRVGIAFLRQHKDLLSGELQ